MHFVRTVFTGFDFWLCAAAIALTLLGLATMFTFEGDNGYFYHQIVWIGFSLAAMCLVLVPDYRFVRTSNAAFIFYIGVLVLLVLVLVVGVTVKGAQSRFDIGFFSIQPSEYAKLALIAVLAKYFSKRHELIGDFRHILVSGAYAFAPFALLILQPDLGSALILFFIWLGMVLVAGISLRHLALVFAVGTAIFIGLWFAPLHHFLHTEEPLLREYQKERIRTFLDPLADIQGAGYNAYQSTVAVGSGEVFGKGVGYGTQSKLQFLPEYETDFIFAAFAEEWGFTGSLLLFALFGVVIWRLLVHAMRGATNFERLFALGVAMLFISHFFVHVGINIGLLPVTGTTIPFLSYGGSHLLTEYMAIGIVMAMGRYTKSHFTAKGELA
jgi:rod shape determining protein RodA